MPKTCASGPYTNFCCCSLQSSLVCETAACFLLWPARVVKGMGLRLHLGNQTGVMACAHWSIGPVVSCRPLQTCVYTCRKQPAVLPLPFVLPMHTCLMLVLTCIKACCGGLLLTLTCTNACRGGLMLMLTCTNACHGGLLLILTCTNACRGGLLLMLTCPKACCGGLLLMLTCPKACRGGLCTTLCCWLHGKFSCGTFQRTKCL